MHFKFPFWTKRHTTFITCISRFRRHWHYNNVYLKLKFWYFTIDNLRNLIRYIDDSCPWRQIHYQGIDKRNEDTKNSLYPLNWRMNGYIKSILKKKSRTSEKAAIQTDSKVSYTSQVKKSVREQWETNVVKI